MENPRTLLKNWLRTEGRKKIWLADQLAVSPATVSMWLNTDAAPQPGNRARIEALTGVPAHLWVPA